MLFPQQAAQLKETLADLIKQALEIQNANDSSFPARSAAVGDAQRMSKIGTGPTETLDLRDTTIETTGGKNLSNIQQCLDRNKLVDNLLVVLVVL